MLKRSLLFASAVAGALTLIPAASEAQNVLAFRGGGGGGNALAGGFAGRGVGGGAIGGGFNRGGVGIGGGFNLVATLQRVSQSRSHGRTRPPTRAAASGAER
ncbi:hypothetical protein [Methylobacterium hispanicum]|uniref:hypothetical protein n=1 Tax=Methylobacterium hispanicum TaxID=270350 RepID=UPI002F35EFF2